MLAVFLVVQGRSCMVARGCGVARGGEKEGERGAGGGVEMFLGRDDFSPTLHPDFYSFRP